MNPNLPGDQPVFFGKRDANRAARSTMLTERMTREAVNRTVAPPDQFPGAPTDTVVWDVEVTSALQSFGLHEGKILWPDTSITPVAWNEPAGWVINRTASGSGSGLGTGEIWIMPLPGKPLSVGAMGPARLVGEYTDGTDDTRAVYSLLRECCASNLPTSKPMLCLAGSGSGSGSGSGGGPVWIDNCGDGNPPFAVATIPNPCVIFEVQIICGHAFKAAWPVGGCTGVSCLSATMSNGTGSFAHPLSPPVEVEVVYNFASTAPSGWSLNYTAPDKSFSIHGVLRWCDARSVSGFYFVGNVTANVVDPLDPTGYPCGCQTTFPDCPPETGVPRQEILSGPDLVNHAESLRIYTACGQFDLLFTTCVEPVPKWWCVSSSCVQSIARPAGATGGPFTTFIQCAGQCGVSGSGSGGGGCCSFALAQNNNVFMASTGSVVVSQSVAIWDNNVSPPGTSNGSSGNPLAFINGTKVRLVCVDDALEAWLWTTGNPAVDPPTGTFAVTIGTCNPFSDPRFSGTANTGTTEYGILTFTV